jgi:hypothetical protein
MSITVISFLLLSIALFILHLLHLHTFRLLHFYFFKSIDLIYINFIFIHVKNGVFTTRVCILRCISTFHTLSKVFYYVHVLFIVWAVFCLDKYIFTVIGRKFSVLGGVFVVLYKRILS